MDTQLTPSHDEQSEKWWRSQGYSGFIEYIHRNDLNQSFLDYFGLKVETYIGRYPECENGIGLYDELTLFMRAPEMPGEAPKLAALRAPPVEHLMTLPFCSLQVSESEFEVAKRSAVKQTDIQAGKSYIQFSAFFGKDTDFWAYDMRVVAIDRDYLIGLNPGRHETGYFHFHSSHREYGRDWVLVELSHPIARKLARRKG